MPLTDFTPIPALLGGALIGLAAVLAMALNGRIAGISGIFAGLLHRRPSQPGWRIGFLAGLVAAPLAVFALAGEMPRILLPVPNPLIVLGGALVGIGTSVAGGCTSGHGVCGTARLSPRSIVATAVFLAAAMVTVYVLRHMLGVW